MYFDITWRISDYNRIHRQERWTDEFLSHLQLFRRQKMNLCPSFMYSLNKQISLNTYYVPSTIWDRLPQQQTGRKIPTSWSLRSSRRRQTQWVNKLHTRSESDMYDMKEKEADLHNNEGIILFFIFI